MAKLIQLDLRGHKKLERKLRKLEPRLRNKYARSAMRDGAKLIADEVRRRAAAITQPGNDSDIMKRVARRIRVRAMRRSRRGVGYRVLTPPKDALGMGSSKWYPPAHIELGTSKTERHGATKPLPYMRPAMVHKGDAARARIARSLWRRVLMGERERAKPTRQLPGGMA